MCGERKVRRRRIMMGGMVSSLYVQDEVKSDINEENRTV